MNILIEDYKITNFQAILLGSDQGRKVYSKKLLSLVERYSLTKKIKFISHCKEMPLAYSLADVVVSASIEPEAFGRVAVESQSMGKPIIASNIGGSKETVLNKKSGFLYKFDDPRALAKNLNSVIKRFNQENNFDKIFFTNLDHIDKVLCFFSNPFDSLKFSGILVNPRVHQYQNNKMNLKYFIYKRLEYLIYYHSI